MSQFLREFEFSSEQKQPRESRRGRGGGRGRGGTTSIPNRGGKTSIPSRVFSEEGYVTPKTGIPILSSVNPFATSPSPSPFPSSSLRGSYKGRYQGTRGRGTDRGRGKTSYVPRKVLENEDDSSSDDEDLLPATYKLRHDPEFLKEELIIPKSNIIRPVKQLQQNFGDIIQQDLFKKVGFPIKITPDLIPILKMIYQMNEKMPVIAVQSPTGTGKSIGIPWIIIKYNPDFKVMVSVPTRAAALSLFQSMKLYDPEIRVGYAADREIRYDTDSQIIYATSGHVENLLYRNIRNGVCGDITFCDVLMIDEIHLGTVANDIIYSLWEYCATSSQRDDKTSVGSTSSPQIMRGKSREEIRYSKRYPRVILSSAFIDDEKFPGIAKYTVATQSYPVQTIFHDEYINMKELYEELAEIVNEYHLTEPLDNHFLVFAPGQKEIERVITWLNVLKIEDVELIPAYSNLETSDLEKIYQEYPDKRKIIVATNIAETAITIEGVGMVFDSLMEKRAETSAIGSLRLVTDIIPRTSSDQRRGRTGRTKPGKYYVMAKEEKYLSLIPTRKDEIERIPLTDTIMSLITVGLDPSIIIKKLTEERKKYAINELIRLELITMEDDTSEDIKEEDFSSKNLSSVKYKVTIKGKFVDKFDLSVYTSSTLYDVFETYKTDDKQQVIKPLHICALLTLIDTYEPPYFRFKPAPKGVDAKAFKEEYKEKYFEKYRGDTDVHVLGNIWNDLIEFAGGYDKLNEKDGFRKLSDWSNKNSMNYRQVKEMLKKLRSVIFTLKKMGYVIHDNLENSKMNVPELIDSIRDIMFINYSEFRMKAISMFSTKYKRPDDSFIYFTDLINTVNNIEEKLPMNIIVLGSTESVDKLGREFRFITLHLDVDPSKSYRNISISRHKTKETEKINSILEQEDVEDVSI